VDTTITLNTKSFKFNYIHLLILIGLTASVFILTHVLPIKRIAEATPEFDFEDIAGLAEEIYDEGAITEAVKNLPLDAALIKKMSEEIERQLAKTVDYPVCAVYFLYTRQNANYPVLGYANAITDYEYMRKGEVWKVGNTKNGELGRYTSEAFYKNSAENVYLTRDYLRYQEIYKGTYKQCIILEKLLIYTYSLWSGHSDLIKPPGCKIFR